MENTGIIYLAETIYIPARYYSSKILSGLRSLSRPVSLSLSLSLSLPLSRSSVRARTLDLRFAGHSRFLSASSLICSARFFPSHSAFDSCLLPSPPSQFDFAERTRLRPRSPGFSRAGTKGPHLFPNVVQRERNKDYFSIIHRGSAFDGHCSNVAPNLRTCQSFVFKHSFPPRLLACILWLGYIAMSIYYC